MAEDDEAARKARAEELRRQISRLAKPQAGEGEESPAAPDAAVSPRDFIHKKMQELDNGDK